LIPSDSLRAALDAVFRSPAYDWAAEPRGPELLRQWWLRLHHWLEALRQGHPTLFLAMVVGLIVVLAAILLHGAVIMALTVRAASAPGDTAAAVATTRRTPAWYRREADALAEAGRYREAMQATFTALALELDQRGAVRFHPGKTPAEYAREARLGPADRESLGGIVRGLYGAVFGGAPVGRDEYLRWRDAGRGGWHAVAP
jgi:hypothetical protein